MPRPAPDKPDRLLRISEVSAIMHLCSRTIYRLVQRGLFPQPIYYSKRIMRWKKSTIEEHLRQKEATNA
jgi:predicted DNA-binding transcriptional regulator AlpA